MARLNVRWTETIEYAGHIDIPGDYEPDAPNTRFVVDAALAEAASDAHGGSTPYQIDVVDRAVEYIEVVSP